MSTVGGSVRGSVGRLLGRPHERRAGYVFCPEDGFWFRPSYTEGKCPLCGAVAPGGVPPPRTMRRTDRSWLGMAALALESVAMLGLVLFMYFKG